LLYSLLSPPSSLFSSKGPEIWSLLMCQRSLLTNKSHFNTAIAALFLYYHESHHFDRLIVALYYLYNKITGISVWTFKSFIPWVTPSNKIKMFGFLNHTTYSYYSIYVLSLQHFFASINKFETSRNIPTNNMFSRNLFSKIVLLHCNPSVIASFQQQLKTKIFAFGTLFYHKRISFYLRLPFDIVLKLNFDFKDNFEIKKMQS
jgi:hypothetical protein